ncbi:hypothetical protein BGW36DRAFT_310701 [Talaromyces proteolyticus]|uniref:Rhodopsin domain-containing protein n=1 Tax=Talaromyces proteolyticus TaxID=1131652 RepID=A0AAD4Q610_9EURO|nr:uncharacterized protein BGW36DRAFT_310701 [Talaromyces proteolyticus]KAH8705206.1 hypothetical protein BGW36DRAFT_310701 [Talaromyces proteolyticus]
MPAADGNSAYNAGPHLLRDVWAFAGVSILVMILRILAKIRIRKFGWDDILMICSLCLALVGSAILTIAVQDGYGQPATTVSDTSTVILYDYLGQTFGISGGVLGRISFIVLINGILGSRKGYRLILWTLVAAQVIVNILFILIIFLQCPGHASAIWSESDDSAKCWDLRVQTYYGYFEGSFNSATDLYLAAFSTYVFWNLNLKLRVKVGLISLLCLGIFAMAASIVKTVQLHVLASANSDPTKATINLERWLYIETYLVIITTSIPCIRSLIRRRRQGQSYGSSGRNNTNQSHELSSPYIGTSSSSFRTKTRMSALSGKSVFGGNGGMIMNRCDDFEEIGCEDELPSRRAYNRSNSRYDEESHDPGITRKVDFYISVGRVDSD